MPGVWLYMGKIGDISVISGLLAILAGAPVPVSSAESQQSHAALAGPADPRPGMDELVVSPTHRTRLIPEPGPGPVFVDQYLLDSDVPEEGFYVGAAFARPGRRFFGTELVYYKNESDIFGEEPSRMESGGLILPCRPTKSSAIKIGTPMPMAQAR